MPVNPVEQGMHTVTPYLVCAGAAEALTFYAKAFGATEIMRLTRADGKIGHAEVRIGDSVVMLSDECEEAPGPRVLGGTPVMLHLAVDDVDGWFQRAVEAGASARMAPEDMFWGDRFGMVADPFGHQWSMASHVRDVPFEDMQRGMQQLTQPGQA